MSARVHDFLDESHSTVLVSLPASFAQVHSERKLSLQIKEPIINIRELSYEEQISKSMLKDPEWVSSQRSIILHVMPNINQEQLQMYFKELYEYLQSANRKINETKFQKNGMLIAELEKGLAEDLLKSSNIIFKIEPLPIGRSTSIIANKPRISGKVASLQSPIAPSSVTMPIVCVTDTGVSCIPQLNGLIHYRSKENDFLELDDSHIGLPNEPSGHGTPIACLVSLGEGGISPRAKLISHKIHSEDIPDVAYEGMLNCLDLYAGSCRIFTSSIVFDNEDNDSLYAYAKLDKIVQEKNICFVSPAGNIPFTSVISGRYPIFIHDFPVLYPAQNSSIIAVGSITKRAKNGSIAPKDALSPFTRVGTTIPELYDSLKPDLVEHGGNICPNGDSTGIGLCSYDKIGIAWDSFTGTSFSAPLVAGRIAEIFAKYGDRIINSETIKALLFMSCKNRDKDGYGHGIPSCFLSAKENQAVLVFEGTIKLSDRSTKKTWTEYTNTVSVPVPAATERIDMCLVHSDNYMLSQPSLDTYLRVRARKGGNPTSAIPPDNKEEQQKRKYVKFLHWSFKRKSMQAAWDFEIIPESSEFIDSANRQSINVRYGCVIILSAAPLRRFKTLTQDVLDEMNRWK